jgi:DNA-binding ferritin-like protein
MIDKLLGLQNQLRMYHWGTNSYAEHKALGKAYEGLDALIDGFVETWMGIHGKDLSGIKLDIRSYSRGAPEVLLNQASAFLSGELAEAVKDNTDLSNIRDEMLGLVNQTKYLLTLK